jgi:hypothetical protein
MFVKRIMNKAMTNIVIREKLYETNHVDDALTFAYDYLRNANRVFLTIDRHKMPSRASQLIKLLKKKFYVLPHSNGFIIVKPHQAYATDHAREGVTASRP